jgi:hypothetical protein
MPHCWAHIFVVKGLKVICSNPQHVLFLRMQDGAQFKYPHLWEMMSIKFQRVGNKNQSNAPHMPDLPPWSLTLIGAYNYNSSFWNLPGCMFFVYGLFSFCFPRYHLFFVRYTGSATRPAWLFISKER